MSRLPGWLGRLGAGLSRMGERLDERRVEAEREDPDSVPYEDVTGPVPAPAPERPAPSDIDTAPPLPADAPTATDALDAAVATAEEAPDGAGRSVPAPPSYAPAVAARPDPVAAIPWGMRVAAEASWRLLVFAGTLWVLMKVISSVQLVVLAFVAALLVTALLQPTVARLRTMGMPRGVATAVTAVSGFVVMGLVGWFVVWQVMDNIDNLSDQVKDGIEELKLALLNSPFHVTEQQINGIAKNLSDSVGANAEQITQVGLQGVTVVVEALTGILLAMFSTLFLLYDGKKVWEWTLKLVPAQARPGVAGCGAARLAHPHRLCARHGARRPDRRGLHRPRPLLPRRADGRAARRLHLPVRLHPAGRRGDLRCPRGRRRPRHQRPVHRAHGARRRPRRAADRGPCAPAVHPRPRGTGPPAGRRPRGRGRMV